MFISWIFMDSVQNLWCTNPAAEPTWKWLGVNCLNGVRLITRLIVRNRSWLMYCWWTIVSSRGECNHDIQFLFTPSLHTLSLCAPSSGHIQKNSSETDGCTATPLIKRQSTTTKTRRSLQCDAGRSDVHVVVQAVRLHKSYCSLYARSLLTVGLLPLQIWMFKKSIGYKVLV